MFFELHSLVVDIISDFFELLLNQLSFPSLTFLLTSGIIVFFAWRSTYIAELPPPPHPPYVIQVSATSTNNNGERNSLSDVRLISAGVDVDNFLRRYPSIVNSGNRGLRIRNNTGTTASSSGAATANNQGTVTDIPVPRGSSASATARTNIRIHQHHHSHTSSREERGESGGVSSSTSASAILGLIRPSQVIRPFLQRGSGGNQNLIVYHRVNVYHHHHHHHHSQYNNRHNRLALEVQNIPVEGGTSATTSSVPLIQEDVEFPSDNSVEIERETVELRQSPSSAEPDGGNESGLTLGRTGSASCASETSGAASGTEFCVNKTSRIEARSSEQTIMDSTNSIDAVEEANELRFIIKFLNDTQIEVTSQAREKVIDFKRRQFAAELSENKTVRLIFNGRVLDNDSKTLGESGIFEQCVVHCLIVSRPSASPGDNSTGGNQSTQRGQGVLRGTAEPGIFFVGFVGVFLVFLWFICFHFGQHLFTQSAVVSLTVLTAIFLIGLVAFYLPVNPTNHNQ